MGPGQPLPPQREHPSGLIRWPAHTESGEDIGPEGRGAEEEMVFAWIEAWERIGDEWKLKVVASTNEAGEP